MALILGTIDNYVVAGYIENQNSYVLGPAASNFAVSVEASSLRLQEGAATLASACSFSLSADKIVSTSVFAEAQTTQSATAFKFTGGQLTVSASAAESVDGTQFKGGVVTAASEAQWFNYPYYPVKRTVKTVTNVGFTLATKDGRQSYKTNNIAPLSDNYLLSQTSSDFQFGTDAFTLECWFYQSPEDNGMLIDTRASGVSSGSPWLRVTAFNRIEWGYATTYFARSDQGLVIENQWNHAALTRSGNTVRIFLNGQLVSTSTTAFNFSNAYTAVTVGNDLSNLNDNGFQGYFDEVHVVKGQALYTTNFTPSTQATVGPNTVFYLPGDVIADTNERNNVTVIRTPGSTSFASSASQTVNTGITLLGQLDISGALSAQVLLRGDLPGDITDTIVSTWSAAPEITRSTDVACSATTTVTVDGDPYVFAEIACASSFEQSINYTKILPTAQVTATANCTAEIVGSKGIVHLAQATFTANCAQSAQAAMTYTLGSELPAYTWADTEPSWPEWPDEIWGTTGTRRLGVVFAESVQPTVILSTAQALLSAVATVASIGSTNTKPAATTLTTTFTQTNAPRVTHPAQVALNTAFGLEVELRFVVLGTVTASATSTCSATPTYTAGIVENFVAQSTFTMLAGQDGSFSSTEPSAFGLSVQPTVTHQATAAISAVFTQAISAAANDNAIVLTASSGTMSTRGNATWYVECDSSSAFAQSLVARITNSAEADWSAFNSTLITGREDQADPYRILQVNSENRTLRVKPETRTITLCSQSRQLRVAQPAYNAELDRRVA